MAFFTRFLCIYIFLTGLDGYGQQRDVITVQRSIDFFHFYQLGQACDTLSYNRHDLFYMNVAEARKCGLLIETENAFLSMYSGDTLFRLRPVRHMNYLQYYVWPNDYIPGSRVRPQCTIYKLVTDGTNAVPDPRHITIRFYSGGKDSLLFTNHFYYN